MPRGPCAEGRGCRDLCRGLNFQTPLQTRERLRTVPPEQCLQQARTLFPPPRCSCSRPEARPGARERAFANFGQLPPPALQPPPAQLCREGTDTWAGTSSESHSWEWAEPGFEGKCWRPSFLLSLQDMMGSLQLSQGIATMKREETSGLNRWADAGASGAEANPGEKLRLGDGQGLAQVVVDRAELWPAGIRSPCDGAAMRGQQVVCVSGWGGSSPGPRVAGRRCERTRALVCPLLDFSFS